MLVHIHHGHRPRIMDVEEKAARQMLADGRATLPDWDAQQPSTETADSVAAAKAAEPSKSKNRKPKA